MKKSNLVIGMVIVVLMASLIIGDIVYDMNTVSHVSTNDVEELIESAKDLEEACYEIVDAYDLIQEEYDLSDDELADIADLISLSMLCED